jgi:hypothetical protein
MSQKIVEFNISVDIDIIFTETKTERETQVGKLKTLVTSIKAAERWAKINYYKYPSYGIISYLFHAYFTPIF